MNALRLPTNPTPSVPPDGYVDVMFDTESGSLVIVNADGTTSEVSTAAPAPGDSMPMPGTVAPPYFRVAGGYLYVQQDGVWMQAALEELQS